MPEPMLQRHDLVWLDAQAADAAQAAGPCAAEDPSARRLLADWISAGHPLIVARQDATIDRELLRLGLALPPALGKRRLAFLVPHRAIIRRTPPPMLDMAAVAALPAIWHAPLAALLRLPALRTLAPRLLGSAGMQLASGVECLGAESDIDLLLAPPTWAAAAAALRALTALDGSPVPRLDGEIRNRAGDAVAWRELATDARQILVKSTAAVRLIDRSTFVAGFAAPCGAAA